MRAVFFSADRARSGECEGMSDLTESEILLYELFQFYDVDLGEIDLSEYVEMTVVGDYIFGIGANGAVDKFVVVGVGNYQIEAVRRIDKLDKAVLKDDVYDIFCDLSISKFMKYF